MSLCWVDGGWTLHDMYGRIFESLYRGSMIGSGSVVFAVWPYVIANMRADKEVGAQVDLNPRLLAAIIGEEEAAIEAAIEKLCSPDPQSTSKEEEGRRLVRVGQFAYRVVNGAKYIGVRNLEAKREYDRQYKQEKRSRVKRGKALPNEGAAVKAMGNGDQGHADRLAAETVFETPAMELSTAGEVKRLVSVERLNKGPGADSSTAAEPQRENPEFDRILPGGDPAAGKMAEGVTRVEQARPAVPAVASKGPVPLAEALKHRVVPRISPVAPPPPLTGKQSPFAP